MGKEIKSGWDAGKICTLFTCKNVGMISTQQLWVDHGWLKKDLWNAKLHVHVSWQVCVDQQDPDYHLHVCG